MLLQIDALLYVISLSKNNLVWYFIQASELNSFGLKSGQKEERQRYTRTSNLIQEKEKGERK